MSRTDKTTDASKVELTDTQLDGAQGGAAYLKLGDIDGESRDAPTEEVSFNFTKIEYEYGERSAKLDKSSTKLKF